MRVCQGIREKGARSIKDLSPRHKEQIKTRKARIDYYYRLITSGERAPIKLTCQRFRIDRATFRLWLRRYEGSGGNPLSLVDLSRRPKNIRFKIPLWVKVLIIITRLSKGWCAARIATDFKRRKIFSISHQGVHNIFVPYGISSIAQLHLKRKAILNLLIRVIDSFKPVKKRLRNALVALVGVMLNLNKKLQTAKENEKEQIQHQIEKTDKEINKMVHRLYGPRQGRKRCNYM